MSKRQKRQRMALEIKDLLTGAAFPFMLQLVFSASLILFADYSQDVGIQITALIFGELMLIGAYVLFGRQNGIAAYRKFVLTSKKRELNTSDVTAYYRTGEYAIWKGIVIGVISVTPYLIIQFIQCVAANSVCTFVLRYAFGWAAYPFILIGQIPSVGELSEWLNFIWAVVIVGVHTGAYIWGASIEKKRQRVMEEAQGVKDKKHK